MAELISTKAVSLGFREVGSLASVNYTPLMGVLQGLQITHDAVELTPVDAEFYDAPFLNIPKNGAFKLVFDLVKFDWSELPNLIGGTYDNATKKYKPAATAAIVMKEFKLDFGTGIKNLLIMNGQIACNWDGTDLKTSPLKLHMEITATPDSDGDTYIFVTDTVAP